MSAPIIINNMKKNNSQNKVVVQLSSFVVLLLVISLLITGCGVALKIRGYFEPKDEYRELSIDTSKSLPKDQALEFIVRSLNATKYGILLKAQSSYENKVFEYDEIYVGLQEKITRHFWRRRIMYVVGISSQCAQPENTEAFLTIYSKRFYSGSEKAKKLVTALISLGASPCSAALVKQ